ncbi:MAG: ATP-binding cassette domain-containing protein [Propionibacteriaceae bacterium]|jgi:branched-chain amino acid transport system ATP-binding protein|nr:ATP-binding cassette domain-containing protein [Propionibacteriaceae bacterium]
MTARPVAPEVPVLETRAVSKSYYGAPAVIDLSVTVLRGETLAIIGPNGAGKSTYFGLIAGEHATGGGGSILFNGVDITHWSAHRRAQAGMSRTFQVARLFTSRRVIECLQIAAAAKRNGHRSCLRDFRRFATGDQDHIERIMAGLGLAGLEDVRAGNLAQGDRKRLELAMAMVQRPALLLLDEPTAGMSTEDCLLTVDTLKGIQRADPDLTIVMTGHDMDVLFAVARRIVLMAEGRQVMDGTPEEVGSSQIARKVYLGDEHV